MLWTTNIQFYEHSCPILCLSFSLFYSLPPVYLLFFNVKFHKYKQHHTEQAQGLLNPCLVQVLITIYSLLWVFLQIKQRQHQLVTYSALWDRRKQSSEWVLLHLDKIKIMSEEPQKCQKRFPNLMLTFVHKKVQIHYIAYLFHKDLRHGADLIFLCSSLKDVSLTYKINVSP